MGVKGHGPMKPPYRLSCSELILRTGKVILSLWEKNGSFDNVLETKEWITFIVKSKQIKVFLKRVTEN